MSEPNTSLDDKTFAFSPEEAEKLREWSVESDSRGERAKARHAAENALREIRDRIHGADDRLGGLVERLRSGEPGELSAADAALVADCVEAESMHLTLADLKNLDPFPGQGASLLLTIPASQVPAFTLRDVPRLRKLADEVRSK